MILGIDPGIQHLGVAQLTEDGKYRYSHTFKPPKTAKTIHQILRWQLAQLEELASESPRLVVIEEVAWYGRARRITLPLSHIAGAIAGYFAGFGDIGVCMVIPSMKKKMKGRKAWDEHQKDAVNLALVGYEYLRALDANDLSMLKRLSAVERRLITAPPNVPMLV